MTPKYLLTIFLHFTRYRQDRANIVATTRASTGKLPLPRQFDLTDTPNRNSYVTQKIIVGETKEKIEQELRLQREANDKKRVEAMKQGMIIFSLEIFIFLTDMNIF